MKPGKLLSLLLVMTMFFSISPTPSFGAENGGPNPEFSEMSVAEFNGSATTEDFYASIFQFDKDLPRVDLKPGAPAPAEFTGVTYQLADNVVKVSPKITQSIRSVKQVKEGSGGFLSISRVIDEGGLLKASQLQAVTGKPVIKPGTVFVDEENGLAFKVPSLPGQAGEEFEGYLPVVKPQFSEVIKELTIPDQTVHLNQSNIAYYAEDVDGNSLEKYLVKPGTTYTMSTGTNKEMEPLAPKHMDNVVAALRLPEKGITMKGTTKNGSVYNVNLKGYLAFGDMDLNGSYGKWGYQFYLTVTEELQLQAVVATTITEEIRIPLLGAEINLGKKIGRVGGGLFLIVGVDGKLTIQAEAREWVTLDKVGLKGKCAFYIPVSVGPLFKMGDYGFTLDAMMLGAIDGKAKVGAELGINIFGFDLVGAGIYGGMGVSSQINGGYIDARLYGIVQAYGSLIGKTKYIVNWQPTITQKKMKNTAGYLLSFKEVCAYRNEVWGTLHYDGGPYGYLPETGKDITIVVKRGEVPEKTYAANTDQDGNFHASGVDLKKDDQVLVRMQEKDGTNIVETEAVTPTFPFDKAVMLEADFFNDYLKAYIPTVVVKDWATGKNVELKYDPAKVPGSTLTINAKAVTGQNQYGEFVSTGTNVLPKTLFSAKLTCDGFVVGPSNQVESSARFSLSPLRTPVSTEETVENGKPVDVAKDLETLILINERGNKIYTGNATYITGSFTENSILCHLENPKTGMPFQQSVTIPTEAVAVKIYDCSSEADDGTSYFNNTILKKWFWENREEQTTDDSDRDRRRPPVIAPPATHGMLSGLIGSLVLPTVQTDADFKALFSSLPQNTILMSFDDPADDGLLADAAIWKGPAANDPMYNEYVDGTKYIKWDCKVVIPYEGVEIIAEYKEDRKEYSGDSRPEYLSSEWLEKDAEELLYRYMEKYSKMDTMPLPDEINKAAGISNLSKLPSWSKTASTQMVNTGIMDLGRDGMFKSGKVSRSECAAYLSGALGIAPEMAQSNFTDMIHGNPYIPQINAAVSYGIISGYSPQSFGPTDPVTREQMAAMVMRGLKKKLGSSLSIPAAGKNFTDRGNFSSYAASAISEISALGIMNGYPDGSFGPKKNITFNEMAVMLNQVQAVIQKQMRE